MTPEILASTGHFQALRAAGFTGFLTYNEQGDPDVLLATREAGDWFDVVKVHSATDVEGRRVRSGDLDTGALLGVPSVRPRWLRKGTLADVVAELLELPTGRAGDPIPPSPSLTDGLHAPAHAGRTLP